MATLTHPLAKAVAKAMLYPGDFHRKVRLVASHLVSEFSDDEKIIDCIHDACHQVTRRHMTRSEVTNVVRWVRSGKGHGVRTERAPKEITVIPTLQTSVDDMGWTVEKMMKVSDPIPANPGEALAVLYDGDPWLCIGFACHDFAVRRLSDWVAMDLTPYERMVANPFNAPYFNKPDGSTSFKCNELVSHRMFIVIEFDDATMDQQATRLGWLGSRLPLCMVTRSGGKSLHGFFKCEHVSKPRQRMFFERALTIGADRSMWTLSQFSRLPGGMNHKTNLKQDVLLCVGRNAKVGR